MSDLERRLAGLSPAKKALLQARLRRRDQESRQRRVIPSRGSHDESPISFAQERIWLHGHLVPGSVVYNRPTNIRLRGPLQIEPLHQALNAIVERHGSLRTTVTFSGESAMLREHSYKPVDIPLTDLSHEDQPDECAQQLAKEEAGRPFDLESGPLLRAHLLRIDSQDHLLLLTFHHFTFDAWSQSVLLQELTGNYEACAAGETPDPEAPDIQFADFAAWDRSERRTADLDAGRSYWRAELADPPVLQLPADHLRPAVPSEEAGYIAIDLSQDLITGLREIGAGESTTMFCTLLGAYSALLYRYTWQSDLVVGCPVAGRTHIEAERLIGVFINSLPLRVHVEATDTFRQVLQRVHSCVSHGLQHQDVPLQFIVQDVLKDRAVGGSPLFQAMFVHERFPLPNRPDASLDFELEDAPFKTTMVDLLLELMESPTRVSGRIVYRRELWEHDSIEQMAGHFQTLLEGIVANPDRKICDLPLLSERVREMMVARHNRVAPEHTFLDFQPQENETISQRFESQVTRYPEHVAIRTATDTLSYADLNTLADRIALAILSTTGNRKGHTALLFDHGASMIAAIFGVLKAGQAFVPLDPLSPLDRLRSILQDSQAETLVTDDHQVALARQLSSASLEIVNSDALPAKDSGIELPDISADRNAYLLYTSGTTGQPKAVIQNHRNVLRHSAIYSNSIHISDCDKLTLFSSYTFDAAMMDTFGALLNGAALYPIDLRTRSTEQVWEWLNDEGVSILHATPTVYRHLMNGIGPDLKPFSFRIVVLGGEPVYQQDVHLYQQKFHDDCLLVNGLGPTESTTALQFFMNKLTPLPGNSVPVGYAVADTEILLINELGDPSDVIGEIAIRSRQVAPGYWQRPELTASRFSGDESKNELRTYRTGDMGRMLADGSLEFIGRNDSQLKLRGYRIELGEIETVLNQHPDVVESVVTLREDRPGVRRLVAYCVSAPDTTVNAAELRADLGSKVPSYMVPAAFVAVAALPRTSTGKINRRALLPVPQEPVQSNLPGSEPRDFLEHRLLQIWKQLFELDSISREDNFFDLGGHSLLAVRLVAEIEKLLGRRLPIAALFQAGTVESLARLLREKEETAPWTSLVPLEPRGDKPPFFFVHGWCGDVYGFVSLARCMAPDQPVYGLQAIDRYGGVERHSSFEEMAAHYVQEIRSFQPEGPYYLGSHSLGGWIAYEIAQQLERQGQEVRVLALFDTRATCRMPTLLALRYQAPSYVGRMMRRFFFHLQRFFSLPRQELMEYFKGRWAALRFHWSALLFYLRGRYRQPLPQPHDPTIPIPPPDVQRTGNYYQALSLRYRPVRYHGVIDLFASEETIHEGPSMFRHLASGGVRIHPVGGDHLTMIDEDHEQDLAGALLKVLRSAQKTDLSR